MLRRDKKENKEKKEKTFYDAAIELWREIELMKESSFDENQTIANAVKTLEKAQILDFFKVILNHQSKNYFKIDIFFTIDSLLAQFITEKKADN